MKDLSEKLIVLLTSLTLAALPVLVLTIVVDADALYSPLYWAGFGTLLFVVGVYSLRGKRR